MKKIGLLTFADALNFGAGLQAYATYKLLESEGLDVRFINYRNKNEAKCDQLIGFMKNASLLDNIKMSIKKVVFGGHFNAKKGFNKFYKGLPKTQKYTKKELRKFDANEDYDYVVIGSDQVWNPQISGNRIDLSFWGDFTQKKVVSISSSCGSYEYTNEDYKKIVPLLKKFKRISVRESFLEKQLSIQKIQSNMILDPTLIYGSNNWDLDAEKESNIIVPEEPYVFLYFVITRYKEYTQYINFIRQELGLKVVLIDRYNIKYENVDYHIKSASPFDFVKLLKNASYVLTDSFHGTAFSIMFLKRFSVLKTCNPIRSKSLLSLIHADSKMFADLDELEKVYDININYSEAFEQLNYQRINSKKFIHEAFIE